MPYLKEYQILYHVDEIIENEESTALVLILSKNRFFGDFITVNRISRTNYHINYSNYHRRARTAKETARILKFIIYQIDIVRTSGNYNLILSSPTVRNGYFYSDRWTSDKMTNISAPVEVGLLHMFENASNPDNPNEIDIAISYTQYYRYLSQWFYSVSYFPVTSPITGKTYSTLPEPPVFYNDVNKLIGCTLFYSCVSVAWKSGQGSGDVSLPVYLLEFSDDTAQCFIIFPSDFGDSFISNYSRRYDNISPYFVGYNAMFNSTTGYQVGYDNGYEAGYAIGRDSSYSNGYSAGYAAGSAGAETGNFLTLFTTIADSQLVLLKGFLDFEFLGFNMLNFFKGLMTVLIAIMVVRLITSGSTSS